MPVWPRLPSLPPALRRIRLRRPTLVVNAALALLLALGGFLSYRTIAVANTATTAGATTSRVVPVTQGQVTSSVSATGTVQSASTAAANFLTAGTVTEIDVKVGDTVKTGQVLAKVNATTAQEQLTAARANLASAQQSLARAQSASTVDAATVTAAQAQVTNSQNSVNSAQRAVDGTTLTAPMDGTVIAVNGTVGGSSSGSSSSGGSSSGGSSSGGSSSGGSSSGGSSGAAAGGGGANGGTASSGSASTATTGFIRIADLSKMQVSVYFSEADATKLKADQATTVTWAALSGAHVTGRIATISPTATSQNNVNSYAVTVSLDSLPDGVRIGQTVTALVTVAQTDNAVRVPAAAVRGTGQRHTVDVVTAGGKRETRQVEVGVQGDQFVEITSGLQPGEQVALNIPTGTGGTTGNGRVGGGGFPGGGGGFPGGGANGGARTGGGNRGGGAG
jgi:macrolide-specific efflux system membrane fusion protein